MIFDFDTLVSEDIAVSPSEGERQHSPSPGGPANRAGSMRWGWKSVVMGVCISLSGIGYQGATGAEVAGVSTDPVATKRQASARPALVPGAKVAPSRLEVVRSLFESEERSDIPEGVYPVTEA